MSISNLIDSERTVYIRLRDRATRYRFMSDAEREGITYSDGSSPTELAAEDIRDCMYRMALAQKYQSIYAQLQDVEYEQCNYGEAIYETLLKEQTYSINKDVWGRIDFGNVTLTHEKIGDGS